MKAKDHFIEWLREKILRNPAEPPETAWQEISDSLDLEDSWAEIEEELELDEVWQKVDARLYYHEHLLRFEKISQGLSLAALVILLIVPFLYLPALPEPAAGMLSEKPPIVEQEKAPAIPMEESARKAGGSRHENKKNNSADAPSSSPAFKAGNETEDGMAAKSEQLSPQEHNAGQQATAQQKVNRKDKTPAEPAMARNQDVGAVENYPEGNHAGDGNIAATTSPVVPEWNSEEPGLTISVETVAEAADHKFSEVYPSSYIGAGTAVKVSSLLNSKTMYALERNSLLRSAPGRHQDFYLLYGHRLAKRLLLQADVYLQNKIGQQYHEYREGTYATFQDELSYQSAALSLSWVRKQLSYGKIPVFVRWTAGLYGGRLRSAEESSHIGDFSRTEEYKRFHAGLLAGYEYDLVLHPQLMLSYGLFGRADVMNIYAGTELIPSSFRKTRATSLDLRLTIRYTLKK